MQHQILYLNLTKKRFDSSAKCRSNFNATVVFERLVITGAAKYTTIWKDDAINTTIGKIKGMNKTRDRKNTREK